jgi:uncharacterized protein YcnI
VKLQAVLAALALCVVSTLAGAHVTVWPRESALGAYEKYVVRVPTEGSVATTSIELQMPEGVSFVSMGAPGSFTYELKRTGERVTSIVWTQPIKSGEFAEFAFMARNPKAGTVIAWQAVQHFSDGSSTQWSGPAGDKHPASVTKLTPAADPSRH